MAFEIVTYPVSGNETTLISQNAEHYGEKACCYVKDYLKWGRRNPTIEQELMFGWMLIDFYSRFASTTDILGIDNSEVVVDGNGIGELSGVD